MSLISFTREDGTKAWINPDLVVSAAWGRFWTCELVPFEVDPGEWNTKASPIKIDGLAVWFEGDKEADYPHVYTGEDAKKVERILDRGSGG